MARSLGSAESLVRERPHPGDADRREYCAMSLTGTPSMLFEKACHGRHTAIHIDGSLAYTSRTAVDAGRARNADCRRPTLSRGAGSRPLCPVQHHWGRRPAALCRGRGMPGIAWARRDCREGGQLGGYLLSRRGCGGFWRGPRRCGLRPGRHPDAERDVIPDDQLPVTFGCGPHWEPSAGAPRWLAAPDRDAVVPFQQLRAAGR
jgi:hypothetical protein